MNKIVKRTLSVLLAALMTLSLCLSASAWYEPEGGEDVVVKYMIYNGAEKDAKGQPVREEDRVVEWGSFGVADGIAEHYGFEMPAVDHNGEPINEPTVLDLIVGLLEFKTNMEAENSFTAETAQEQIVLSWGYLKQAFGLDFTYGGFLINGVQPNDGIYVTSEWGSFPTGYSIDEARLHEGDSVTLYTLADRKTYSDACASFEPSELFCENADSATVTLTGYESAMLNGNKTPEEIAALTKPLEGVTVYQEILGERTVLGKTDENGQITVTFEPTWRFETVDLLAYGVDANGTPVIAAECMVMNSNSASRTLLAKIRAFFAKIRAFFAGLFNR